MKQFLKIPTADDILDYYLRIGVHIMSHFTYLKRAMPLDLISACILHCCDPCSVPVTEGICVSGQTF